MVKVERSTKETKVRVELSRRGKAEIAVPDAFFGHMLGTLSKYAGWGLSLKAQSKDGIDHHVIEDAAITLGRAVREMVSQAPVARFGSAVVPMDDALVEAVLDVGGRAFYEGELPMPMMEHAIRSFAFEAGATLHVVVRRGREAHHVVEAAFKAVGMALAQALVASEDVMSTKGVAEYGG